MIACKTGALIRCGLETGALLADGDEASVQGLRSGSAKAWDGAFQITGRLPGYLGRRGYPGQGHRATTSAAARSPTRWCSPWNVAPAAQPLTTCNASTHRPNWKRTTCRGCLAILDEVGAREQRPGADRGSAANRALEALAPIIAARLGKGRGRRAGGFPGPAGILEHGPYGDIPGIAGTKMQPGWHVESESHRWIRLRHIRKGSLCPTTDPSITG